MIIHFFFTSDEYFDKYSKRKNGENSFDENLLTMELENLKSTLEDERQKSRNIVRYYETIIKDEKIKNGEISFGKTLLHMEVENLKTNLEEEREKFRDIAGYYETMIKAYEKKLADEKRKNEVLLWANMDHNVQNWFDNQPN